MKINQNEFLKYNKKEQIMTFMLCLKEIRNKTGLRIPKFVLIDLFKNIKYLFEDSTILNDENHKNMLIKWIKETENIPKQFTKLIYCSSKNGFAGNKFHEFCDNKLNTISLIKANNFIFGGFTSLSWDCAKDYPAFKNDPKSFIFSISNPSQINQLNLNIKMMVDVTIVNNSNEDSYSRLGYSFSGCPFEYETKESKEFLCGSYQFKVQEIEVFQLF